MLHNLGLCLRCLMQPVVKLECLYRWASEHMKKKLTGTGGPALVSAYNVMTQVLVCFQAISIKALKCAHIALHNLRSDQHHS